MSSLAQVVLPAGEWIGVGSNAFELTNRTKCNLVTLAGQQVRVPIDQSRLLIGDNDQLIVLVAGLETNTIWDYIAKDFNQEGHSVLMHQLASCGYHSDTMASSTNAECRESFREALSRTFAELCSSGVSPRKVHLIGHSFGAVFATEIAIDRPFWEASKIEVASVGILAAPIVLDAVILRAMASCYPIVRLPFNFLTGLSPFGFSLDIYRRRMREIFERTGFREHDRALNDVLFYPELPHKGLPQFLRGVLELQRRIRTLDREVPKLTVMDAAYDVLVLPSRQVVPRGAQYVYLDNSGHAIPACWQASEIWQCLA